MNGVGLVLEGGGMRGVYTAGVLEFLLEKELHFNYVIGVSAGACNAASYISRQRGRNKAVTIDMVNDRRYLSLRNLIKGGSLFGWDFIFHEVPNKLVPFDYDTFYNSPAAFVAGATDCNTGKAVYFSKDQIERNFDVLRASSSLPLVSPIVTIDGLELLDGGLADPIPLRKSIQDGNQKNVIVLTQNKGYLKKPDSLMRLYKAKYKKYPALLQTMMARHQLYNDTLQYIEQLEKEGSCMVIRPQNPLQVGRLEKDSAKLVDLYQNGYEDAKILSDQLHSFLNKNEVYH
jgi:predicted patatin/cPLA2 family phospholipase